MLSEQMARHMLQLVTSTSNPFWGYTPKETPTSNPLLDTLIETMIPLWHALHPYITGYVRLEDILVTRWPRHMLQKEVTGYPPPGPLLGVMFPMSPNLLFNDIMLSLLPLLPL